MASYFYKRVYNTILESLIKEVQKLKKPMDDQSAKAFNEHLKMKEMHTW
jgi:hypothetical protein